MADKEPAALGMAFARSLGGPKAKSAGEVLEFLQSKSAEEICAASTFLRDLDHYIPYPWLPIIDDKYLSDAEAFVPKPPLDLVREVNYNRTPIMYGHCKDEGIFVSKVTLDLGWDFHLGVPKEGVHHLALLLS